MSFIYSVFQGKWLKLQLCVNQTVPPIWWLSGKKSACDAGGIGLILGQEDSLEKEVAPHRSILAWGIS